MEQKWVSSWMIIHTFTHEMETIAHTSAGQEAPSPSTASAATRNETTNYLVYNENSQFDLKKIVLYHYVPSQCTQRL